MVAMRFRSDKFTGDIGELWNEYVQEYQQVVRDYGLGKQEKLQYLHNIMGGDAKRLYLNSVIPHVNSYAHAVDLIGRDYYSIIRQNGINYVLSQLRLQDKLGESQNEGEALEKIYKNHS